MRHFQILRSAALILALSGACESNRIALVAETDEVGADFGRTALVEAIVELSKNPQQPAAYAAFAKRIDELRPLFNRDVERQAELRLCVLAVAPLLSGLDTPHEQQMQTFGTTVWPSVLRFPTLPGESVPTYVYRLCTTELALTCNNVVPEHWPAILNARVWRSLKSRVDVAYDRCQWCADDPSFAGILDSVRDAHLRMEMEAQLAQEAGQPSAWAKAGPNVSALETDFVVSFENDGLVKLRGQSVEGGNWRDAIARARQSEDLLALHLRPERMVSDLLAVLGDGRRAGYSRIALVVRESSFPYRVGQYELDASTKSYRGIGVQDSDSIQVLVQSLDHRARKRAANKAP